MHVPVCRILLLLITAVLIACRADAETPTLDALKAEFKTSLTRKERIGEAAPPPPATLFKLVQYTAPLGKMAAYVSPDPGDGRKHPLIIWRVGGFANSLSDLHWKEQDPANDQSAQQYRNEGVLMMYPSLRGGNDNPGFIECCYGEVEDVLAAASFAKTLPYVDPEQIYLGGHSVGGTLALLVAATKAHPFRAVFAFGPAHSVAIYGQENLPFDGGNKMELIARAPLVFLNHIRTDTWIIEGADGNIEALKIMQKQAKNPKLHFWETSGDHFSILAPANRAIAQRIMAASKSADKVFTLDRSAVDAALKTPPNQ